MLRKIAEAAQNTALRAQMKTGGLFCPDCGEKAHEMRGSADEVIECRSCGARGSVYEWAMAAQPGNLRGQVGRPPQGTRITVSDDGFGGRVWTIPASRRFNFFLVFAALWLGITALVSAGFLLAFLTGGEIEGDMPGWVMIPFFGVFWVVGLVFLYLGLREMFASQRITVGGGQWVYRRELFGRAKEQCMALADIQGVKLRVFYQQNHQPVYGIEVRGAGRKIRFGSGLKDEEKAWLVAEFDALVNHRSAPAPQASAAAGGGGYDPLAPIPLRGLAANEPLSVVIPGLGVQGLWMGLVFTGLSVAFLLVGFLVMKDESWLGFRGFWTAFSSIFLVIGLWMTFKFLKERNLERRIEGNDSEISIRTYRNGLILKDQSFSRREVTDIRTTITGNSGGTPMKRLEIIVGDRAVKLAGWIDADDADDIARKVREALGMGR